MAEIAEEKFSFRNKRWCYRGEGNAHLVISLPSELKVLRLKKVLEGASGNEMQKMSIIQKNFIQHIVSCLIGTCYVEIPTLVSIPQEEILIINTNLQQHRPVKRLHKNVTSYGATLWQDHAFLQCKISSSALTYCIEIKPKQGIYPATTPRIGKCLFCLKQQLKIKDGMASEKSSYCPLDLFSGCTQRIKRALSSLFQTPQNNFRIFQDGTLVYGDGFSQSDLQNVLSSWFGPLDSIGLEDRLVDLIHQVLTKDLSQIQLDDQLRKSLENVFFEKENDSVGSVSKHKLHQPHCDWVSHPLPHGSILERIAHVQSLDYAGLDWVYKLYQEKLQTENSASTGNKLCKDYGYVNELLEKKSFSEWSIIERYLISAVAKDCSILVTFQETNCSGNDVCKMCSVPILQESASSKYFHFKVAVVDVDPKPESCIEKHYQRESSIEQACCEAFNIST